MNGESEMHKNKGETCSPQLGSSVASRLVEAPCALSRERTTRETGLAGTPGHPGVSLGGAGQLTIALHVNQSIDHSFHHMILVGHPPGRNHIDRNRRARAENDPARACGFCCGSAGS